ncbi:MAG: phosphoribosylanthranilate isomerase [Armatimonadetes bacterium]|nr:phosphoribosylanthranilate isomerase [Armatimonadota bacterium]
MTRVKICGITNLQDAQAAVEAGADALGFVFAESPRRISPESARDIIRRLPPFVQAVGVFVGEDPDASTIAAACSLDAVQLHSGYSLPYVRRIADRRIVLGIRVKNEASLQDVPGVEHACAILLDAFVPEAAGGSGKTFDWELARQADRLGKPVIVSGGLTVDNVESAVRQMRPYAVDVSSGVESRPGVKDPEKVRLFIERAKATPDF